MRGVLLLRIHIIIRYETLRHIKNKWNKCMDDGLGE